MNTLLIRGFKNGLLVTRGLVGVVIPLDIFPNPFLATAMVEGTDPFAASATMATDPFQAESAVSGTDPFQSAGKYKGN